ncbi:MAG TPA: hypothetical protein VGN05_00380 [Parvibaculum sp.]
MTHVPMTHSACWRAKAMTYVKLSQIVDDLGLKRRCLNLATKCMRYSVRLNHLPKAAA